MCATTPPYKARMQKPGPVRCKESLVRKIQNTAEHTPHKQPPSDMLHLKPKGTRPSGFLQHKPSKVRWGVAKSARGSI